MTPIITELDMMPREFVGPDLKNNGFCRFTPRRWTNPEIKWALDLRARGFSIPQIAVCLYRDDLGVETKLKKLSKKTATYNPAHLADKYATNDAFLAIAEPRSVLDLYAGRESWYRGKVDELYANDKLESSTNDSQGDALRTLCRLYAEGRKFDLVDLDPFGSAFDLFDLAIKTATRGIIITFGEMGCKRFARTDFIRRRYGTEMSLAIDSGALVDFVRIVGERNKKTLVPVFQRDWQNISRTYFLISGYRITEQWDQKPADDLFPDA
jgi:hypothetical protein